MFSQLSDASYVGYLQVQLMRKHYRNLWTFCVLFRQKRGDPVLHIELRKWADVGIVAPLDANTLAKVGPI